LDENGLNITRHKSATATFEKRIDVFFMRFLYSFDIAEGWSEPSKFLLFESQSSITASAIKVLQSFNLLIFNGLKLYFQCLVLHL